jgi:hypothetical protein
VRKAERARFLSEGEKSEALRINGARLHFLLLCLQVENVFFLAKWSLAPFILPFILGAKATCFLTILPEPFFYGRFIHPKDSFVMND